MSSAIVATFIILATTLLIVSSLGYGLFYLLSAGNNGRQVYRALSLRIGLSISLFIGLLLAIHMGWIIPNSPAL